MRVTGHRDAAISGHEMGARSCLRKLPCHSPVMLGVRNTKCRVKLQQQTVNRQRVGQVYTVGTDSALNTAGEALGNVCLKRHSPFSFNH